MSENLYAWLPNLIGVAIAVFAMLLAWRVNNNAPRPNSEKIEELNQKVLKLSKEVDRLENLVEAQMAEIERLKNANTALGDALANAVHEAQHTRDMVNRQDISDTGIAGEPTATVMIAIANDAKLDLDLTALRSAAERANFRITRIYPVTYDKLTRAINRARSARTPIKYLHIAAHMNEQYVQMDKPVTILEMSNILGGVEVLVLNGCKSDNIADHLGVVPIIISMREEVTHEDAVIFARVFWEELFINRGNGESAYYASLRRIPAPLAEFVELHV